ncbi:hypothetical protein V6Z11_A08G077900 [Gossypium hirsutum]
MSQQQPQQLKPDHSHDQEPIKYSDVFNVTGELASKPIAPQDAAAIQREGSLVRHDRANITGYEGVTVTKTNTGGEAWITEAKKVVGQYIQPEVPAVNNPTVTPDPITVGEALEMAVLSTADKADVTTMLPRDKAVTPEDADKVVAAELRNNPYMSTAPGGVTASMTAARLNENSTT